MKKYFFELLLRTLLIIGFLWFLIVVIIVFSPDANAQELSKFYEYSYIIKDSECLPAWEDNIFNIDNEEYLVEVLFNYLEEEITIEEILENWMQVQYYFIRRYQDSCKKKSLIWIKWYEQESIRSYKGYKEEH